MHIKPVPREHQPSWRGRRPGRMAGEASSGAALAPDGLAAEISSTFLTIFPISFFAIKFPFRFGTRLLNGQEWIESLRKVQGSQYRPPQ